jgi:hypothetical protein
MLQAAFTDTPLFFYHGDLTVVPEDLYEITGFDAELIA